MIGRVCIVLPPSREQWEQALASMCQTARASVAGQPPHVTADQDQVVAALAQNLAATGIEAGDAGQRRAFLVGVLSGFASATANARLHCIGELVEASL